MASVGKEKGVTPAQRERLRKAAHYRQEFESSMKIGDSVVFQTSDYDKAKITAGKIEAFTDKGVVIRADKGEIEKSITRSPNFSVSFTWRKTTGTQKKVVAWARTSSHQEYNGKSVFVGRRGG